MSGGYGGLCMDNQSKHSRVKKRIELATAVLKLIVAIHYAFPVLVELFSMAFNYNNHVEI
jgi:hypothetical protein